MGKQARITRHSWGGDTCEEQTKPSPPGGKQSSNCLLGELQWLEEAKVWTGRLRNPQNRCVKSVLTGGFRKTLGAAVCRAPIFKITGAGASQEIGQLFGGNRSLQVMYHFRQTDSGFYCGSEKPINISVWTIIVYIPQAGVVTIESLKFHSSVFDSRWFYCQSKGSADAVTWRVRTTDQKLWLQTFTPSKEAAKNAIRMDL